MYKSGEAAARAIIQRLRPNAMKHGLKGAVVDAYLREFLPKKYLNATRRQMARARDYRWRKEMADEYRPNFIPDLCEIYPDDREIILYEIECNSRVSNQRLKQIDFWRGVTMDGWDLWDVILIITNRYGLGWDILLDTKQESKAYALYRLKKDPEERRKYCPDLMTPAVIAEEFQWRNWTMPAASRFAAIRNSITTAKAGRLCRAMDAWSLKQREKFASASATPEDA